MVVRGRYFYPNSARSVPAQAALNSERMLRIESEDGTLLAEVPLRWVKISPRLADLPRRFALPDGACFETLDNDGVDAFIGKREHLLGGGWVDRLERSWRAALIALVLACASAAAFAIWGIPAIAFQLAQDTPEWLAAKVSDQTLNVLDGRYLSMTTLSPQEQAKAQTLFARIAATGACGRHTCRLLLRKSAIIGANAFAIPDGRVVLTDDLWKLAKSDDEIEGVFAHELAHVRFAHGLQRAYEASLVPAAIAVITGDVSQIGQISVILPGVLMQSAYSREFESQADRQAITTMRAAGLKPAVMAGFLERLDRKLCGKAGCHPGWLGDHPDIAQRAAMFRRGG